MYVLRKKPLKEAGLSVNLRELDFSSINPLVELTKFKVGRRKQHVGVINRELLDVKTGEVFAMEGVGSVEEVSKEQFVQIYREGIKEMLLLSKSAYRVFSLILDVYENEPVGKKAWTDHLSLFVRNGSIGNIALPMSMQTFNKGLKELLAKKVIAPKTPGVFWVNPHLFFKGDKFQFIKAYRIKGSEQSLAIEA